MKRLNKVCLATVPAVMAVLLIISVLTHNNFNKPLSKPIEPQEIYALNVDSIYALEADGFAGSAVAITPEVLVTNCHVLTRSVFVRVNKSPKLLQIINSDYKDLDLCFIYVPDMNFKPVTIRPSDDVKIGEKSFAIGNPLGLNKSLSQGLISNFNNDKFERTWIQTDTQIAPGSSGGGLFDNRGNLIGITSTITTEISGIAFAAKTEPIIEVLKTIDSLPINELNKKQQDFAYAFELQHKNTKNSKDKEVLSQIEACVKHGNIYCTAHLTDLYLNQKDYKKAHALAVKVAEANLEYGNYVLSEMYYRGLGVPKDLEQSTKYSKAATLLGDQGSAFNVGIEYYKLAIKNHKSKDMKSFKENIVNGYAWMQVGFIMGQKVATSKGQEFYTTDILYEIEDILDQYDLQKNGDDLTIEICSQITRCVLH